MSDYRFSFVTRRIVVFTPKNEINLMKEGWDCGSNVGKILTFSIVHEVADNAMCIYRFYMAMPFSDASLHLGISRNRFG